MTDASTVIKVPIVKSKGFVEIDTQLLPDEVYKEALLQGLKVLANRGMSKISKTTYPVEDELKAAAQEAAETNRDKLYKGDIKVSGAGKASKASGAVMTEARRLAKNLVKDEMKRQGIKISHVEASEITKAANALLAADESIIEQAKVNLAEREKTPIKIDVKALIHTSAKKVAASEAKKVKDKPLSAKQAGKVAPRAKAKAPAAQPSA